MTIYLTKKYKWGKRDKKHFTECPKMPSLCKKCRKILEKIAKFYTTP